MLACYNLAALLAAQGKADESVIHLKNAVQLTPDYYDARLLLAHTLGGQGKASEANFGIDGIGI